MRYDVPAVLALTRRILTVNIAPLAILVIGVLYLDEYRDGLLEADLAALETQSEIFAGALGEGAIGTRLNGSQFILPAVARPMLRRLTSPTRTRALVFGADGKEIADSLFLAGQGGAVQVVPLPMPGAAVESGSFLNSVYDTLLSLLPARHRRGLSLSPRRWMSRNCRSYPRRWPAMRVRIDGRYPAVESNWVRLSPYSGSSRFWEPFC